MGQTDNMETTTYPPPSTPTPEMQIRQELIQSEKPIMEIAREKKKGNLAGEAWLIQQWNWETRWPMLIR